ncbi:hypothetical protein [Pseudalkalibacillus caeni]|uniref:Uncharacterized protein n=1 Tax=Exobacillus caeni TaxID=2574798 RepID=A0A5R9F6U3_9BACL|nr:hypothetical protein [Pseudalkalibacillus caeni]TLS38229.1 hypothetical protein FCL54_06755 [Pseudalkalibacillus caeni]
MYFRSLCPFNHYPQYLHPVQQYYHNFCFCPPGSWIPPRLPAQAFPPVEVKRFQSSAASSLNLLKDAETLAKRISVDAVFAHDLKDAAQRSDKEAVHRMIKETGISVTFETKFTPDGIRVEFLPKNPEEDSKLMIILEW